MDLPVSLPPGFLKDRALLPLRKLAGPTSRPALRHYLFYMKGGFFWISDGMNEIPVNPALMGYFEKLFSGVVAKFGRGALFSILGGAENGRYLIVTDNNSLKAGLAKFPEGLALALKINFPPDAARIPQ